MIDLQTWTQKIIEGDHFTLVLLTLIAVQIISTTRHNRFSLALLNLPGTLFHELAHYLVGLLLLAKPNDISIWPKKQPDGGFRLGSVSFSRLNSLNALPTSLAPLLLLPLAYQLDRNFLDYFPLEPPYLFLKIFLVIILLKNALPSRTDLSIALKYRLGLLIYSTTTAIYLYRDDLLQLYQGHLLIIG
ncbi:hypothetical protein ACQZV8_21785 [Magnetococcales bacterium HHB-1]